MNSDEHDRNGDNATDESGETQPAEVKQAFRDALARKKSQHHAHNEGAEDAGKVHAQRAATTKRMFRRKSG